MKTHWVFVVRSTKNAVKQVLLNAHLSFIDSSLTIVAYHSRTFHTFITWPLPVQMEFDWEKVINRTHVKGLFSRVTRVDCFYFVEEKGVKAGVVSTLPWL